MRKLGRVLAAWGLGTRGAAAAEFAIVLLFLILPLINIVDLAVYGYSAMQLESAAQMGAEAIWSDCNGRNNAVNLLPATIPANHCPFITHATVAIHDTALGANVSFAAGSPSEGFYCATTSGGLTAVTSSTANCSKVSGASDPSATPGDYIQVVVKYTYSPLFAGATVSSLLPAAMTNATAAHPNGYMMRLQ